MIFASLLLLVLSCVIARRKGGGRALRWVLAFGTFAVLLLVALFVVADRISGRGVDESVVYHLRFGLEGAGFGEYKSLIFGSIAFVVLSLGAAVYVFTRVPWRPGEGGDRWTALSLAVLLAAVGTSPATIDLAGLLIRESARGESDGAFQYVRPDVGSARSPMNVVFVYLESFERTYLDEGLFPGLTPGMKALERQGTSYTDIRQVYGTGWTVAGMTASQCGIPLVTASAGDEALGNSMSGLKEFLPGAFCIGDILAAQGYALDYMGGASLEFAGKGNLYRTHGFQTVQGFQELGPSMAEPAYRSAWGLYDDTLFDMAAERFAERTAEGRPFGLFFLTLDTHHPNGHMSARCGGIKYQAGDNPILNAVHCGDALVSDLVARIRAADSAKNTLIVIASDHLAMRNTASGTLDKGDRKNLLLVLPPGPARPEVENRPASTLDIGPTVLSVMGFDVEALGYGRDLSRSKATIVESLPDANRFLSSRSTFLSGFWQFPQLDRGLTVEPSRRLAHLGGSSIKLPAMLLLGPGAEVKEILFDFNTPSKSLADHLGDLPPSQPLVWIDACQRVSVVDTARQVAADQAGFCVAVGRMDSEGFHVGILDGQVSYERETLEHWLAGETDQTAIDARRARLENYRRFGSADTAPIQAFPGRGLGGDLLVVASGGPGPSFVGGSGEFPGGGLELSRGLTLLGVRDDAPVKLAHFDSCNPGRPVSDSMASADPFGRHIDKARKVGFSTFVIVGHDSVVCPTTTGLESLFAGLPLEKWKGIAYRQPYLGVIAAGGDGWEQLGPRSRTMTLHLVEFAAARDATGASGSP